MRATGIPNANIKQAETYESHRRSWEFDLNYFECDDNIASIDCYNMDQEQADCNRNESDDGWVEYVKKTKKTMEDILYMIASVSIIYFSLIKKIT